jgi:putative restriction endonuclease
MKGIFDTRPGTVYDDEIQTRYHFPNKYLAEARQTVGDWIVYRAPRRGGGSVGYFACAQVVSIDPDPADRTHSYARMSDFLEFDKVIPLARPGGFYERQLELVERRSLGRTLHGKSVRTIHNMEFADIVRAGLQETLDPANAVRLGLDPIYASSETVALVNASADEQERRIVRILMNRKVRDANFRRHVCEAYQNTCAVTRLRMINGGGKSEAQAAHIWPVAEGGPDVVQNGLALSSTAHWLFDRHLISLTDDYGLLVSHNRVPVELQTLFEKQRERIHLPDDRTKWPHLEYVRRHRAAYVDHASE